MGANAYNAQQKTTYYTSDPHAHVDPPLRVSHIAIVGFAEDDRALVPWDAQGLEIWGLNMAHTWMPRWDRLFEMHDRSVIEAESIELKRDSNHLGALKDEQVRPVYMLKEHADITTSVAFPIAEFQTYFGTHCTKLATQPYATSTFGYMLGLAIMKLHGLPNATISVYGVHLMNDEEYAYQRENATFFAGFALGRNIRIELTPNATWLEADGLYGYQEPATIEILTRLQRMAIDDEVDYTKKYDDTLRENDILKARAAAIDGARQYAKRLQTRLKVLLRGGKI